MFWLVALLLKLVAFVAAALLGLYIYGLRPAYRWKLRHIPGPPMPWLYGNWIESFVIGNHVFQEKYTKIYGPIWKCWGVTGPEICVSEPELVRKVLLSNINRTPFPSMVPRTKHNAEFVDSHILTARDEKWRGLREAWSPFFFSGSLEQFAERMNYSVTLMCQRLESVADSSTGQTIDMYPLLTDLTMDVIARVSFGVELNTQQPLDKLDADGLRGKQLREDAMYSFASNGGVNSKWFFWVLIFPELAWPIRKLAQLFPDPALQKLMEAQGRILSTVGQLIRQHREAVQAEEGGMDVHDSVSSQHGLANGHAHGLADSQDVGLSSPSSNGIGAGGVSAQPPAANSGLQTSPVGDKVSGMNAYRSGLASPRPTQSPRPGSQAPGLGQKSSAGLKPSDLAVKVQGSMRSRKGVQPGSFMDLLVRGFDRQTGKPFSDGAITRQGHAMLLAGFETTAATLASTTFNLARYPDKAAKLVEEARRQPEEPTLDSLEHMPYADACLRESLRLYPSAATGNREAQRDMILGGYKVTAGTQLKCSFWAMHRDPKLWEDAEDFIPERWVAGTPEAAKRPVGAWEGFGDGARACPGGKLAFEEAKIALVHLFRRFDFRLAPGQVPYKLRSNITTSPLQGVHVSVKRREL